MRSLRTISLFLILLSVFAGAIKESQAQASAPADSLPQVVMTHLFPPVYPPLAKQARITGDVQVSVYVRADGTVVSAESLSGHPMLANGAVENAEKSEYECRKCTHEMEYKLIYTFGLIDDFTPYNKFEEQRVPAAKCLYLWKCGVTRVNVFDPCNANIPPQITQSPGHVKILVIPPCLNTMESRSASR
jgi:TonB family protein